MTELREGQTLVGVRHGRVELAVGDMVAVLSAGAARNVAMALLKAADILEGKSEPVAYGFFNKDGSPKS